MKYVINPINCTFDELKVENIEEAIVYIIDSKKRKIQINDKAWVLQDYMYADALANGQLIELDTEKTRCQRIAAAKAPVIPIDVSTTRLADVQFDQKLFDNIITGTYIDSFFTRKGGISRGCNIMLTGDPGVGKSSNLMDILVNIAKVSPQERTLYVSAEMSQMDVVEFLQYYPGLENIDFLFLGDYVVEDKGCTATDALIATLDKGWDLVMLDSIFEVQSMAQEDLKMTKIKAEKYILDLLNKYNRSELTTFICIQQQNKAGEYVGSKRLEHMTSAFIQLCWDTKEKGKRYMIFHKNRKGQEKVRLYYTFANGVQYDSARHTLELEMMLNAQNSKSESVEQISSFDDFMKSLGV